MVQKWLTVTWQTSPTFSFFLFLRKRIFFGRGIKINQKLDSLKLLWLTPSLLWLRTWDTEEESASSHEWDWKRKTTQGVFVLCLNSAVEGESGGGVRGWGAGEKKFLAAAQPEARKYGALFLSQRHQPSVLARHYFTSCRGHTPSLRHTRASSGITRCVAALIYSEVLPASDPQTRPSQTERKEKRTAVLSVLKAKSYHQAVPLHDSSPSMVFNFKMKIESWFALLVLLFLEKMAEGFIGKSWQSED